MDEAENAMDRICRLVEQVLASNRDMSNRLRAIDEGSTGQNAGTPPRYMRDGEDSITSDRSTGGLERPHGSTIQRNALGFAFEEELLNSRVYKRPLFSESGGSLVTSAARTTATSILSALS